MITYGGTLNQFRTWDPKKCGGCPTVLSRRQARASAGVRTCMPEARFELARGCPRWILSPLRLPFRHSGRQKPRDLGALLQEDFAGRLCAAGWKKGPPQGPPTVVPEKQQQNHTVSVTLNASEGGHIEHGPLRCAQGDIFRALAASAPRPVSPGSHATRSHGGAVPACSA
jgi:hypothetical protein